MNRNCSARNIKIDMNNYKKNRTVCKSCYNKNKKERRNNNNTIIEYEICTSHQQPKIDNVNNKNNVPEKRNNANNVIVSAYENHLNVVIGPRKNGKTYYILEILEKTDNRRPIQKITRSPNQYPNYKTNTEIKSIKF